MAPEKNQLVDFLETSQIHRKYKSHFQFAKIRYCSIFFICFKVRKFTNSQIFLLGNVNAFLRWPFKRFNWTFFKTTQLHQSWCKLHVIVIKYNQFFHWGFTQPPPPKSASLKPIIDTLPSRHLLLQTVNKIILIVSKRMKRSLYSYSRI